MYKVKTCKNLVKEQNVKGIEQLWLNTYRLNEVWWLDIDCHAAIASKGGIGFIKGRIARVSRWRKRCKSRYPYLRFCFRMHI